MPEQIKHIFHEQERSRKKVRVGDVFVMKLDDGYLYGRVVSDTAMMDKFSDPEWLLLYVYAGVYADDTHIPREVISPPRLLIPPVITNRLGWRHGYFRTVGNLPIQSDQLLPRHVFRSPMSDELWDEGNARITAVEETDLVGCKALDSYLSIEDSVSRALGYGSIEQ